MFEFDEIEVMDSIQSQIMKCFKKHKYLIIPQLTKTLNIQVGSIRGELTRMISNGIIKSERKAVKLNKNEQFRTMTVYYLVNKHEK